MTLGLSKRALHVLIGGNIAISLLSLRYDAPILPTIPYWAWAFVIICPLYPLVLALFYYGELTQKRNDILTAIAVLSAATYGLAALAYYPLHMYATFYNWLDTGNIFWVWLYATQGWWLIRKLPRPHPLALTIATGFILCAFTIQFRTLSFGYLDYASLSNPERIGLLLVGYACCLVSLITWLISPVQPGMQHSKDRR